MLATEEFADVELGLIVGKKGCLPISVNLHPHPVLGLLPFPLSIPSLSVNLLQEEHWTAPLVIYFDFYHISFIYHCDFIVKVVSPLELMIQMGQIHEQNFMHERRL